MMVQFRAIGQWRREQVIVRDVPCSHALPADLAEQVETAWRQTGARPGVKLFDGPMVRWEGLEAGPQRLVIRVSRTSYRLFVATNMRHPEWADRYGPQVMANPVGLSAALVSGDGFLLLGRRNAQVAYYPRRLHPFAGALEPAEATDPFAGIARELHEELSLAAGELAETVCLGIVEDAALRQGEIIFRVRSALDRAAIVARLDEGEHGSAISLRPDRHAIEALLARRSELTPVGAATVLLWGRSLFGQAWFDRRRQVMTI